MLANVTMIATPLRDFLFFVPPYLHVSSVCVYACSPSPAYLHLSTANLPIVEGLLNVPDTSSLSLSQCQQYQCMCRMQSYLNVPNLLSAALSRGAEAIHPGYGFLSENASFVQMCRDHGIAFIGPNPENITVMGDKATARKTMDAAGVPTVPGSPGLVLTEDAAQKVPVFALFPSLPWCSYFFLSTPRRCSL